MAAAVIRVTSHHTNVDDGSTADVAGTTLAFRQTDSDVLAGGAVPHNAGGTNYSYVKNLRLYVLTGPTNLINNLKAYWTGAAVANIDVKGKAAAAYLDPTAQTTTALTGVTSMYTYTATAPLSLNGSFVVGTDVAPKFVGDWLQLQLAVGNAAILSPTPLGSLIYRWDES